MKTLPVWLEKLLIKALKDFVPPSVIADAIASFKVEMFAKLRELAARTDTTIDDMIVDRIEAAFNACSPDLQFVCDLIQKGEDAFVDFLRATAAKTDTKIDDAVVDILAAALKK